MTSFEATVDGLMGGLRADLERLAAIPSIAFPGFPAEPVEEAHDLRSFKPIGVPLTDHAARCAFVREYAAVGEAVREYAADVQPGGGAA
ncbi:hypothetical protein [Streptomyces sp. NPDC003006]